PALAAVQADVPVVCVEAALPRSDVVGPDRLRLPLLHAAPADLDELVRTPAARVVPAPVGADRVRDRDGRAAPDLLRTALAPGVVRGTRLPAAGDRRDGQ